MVKILLVATSLLLIQAAHSYILLTANIEDIQNVAKRLVQLPISGQVGNIVRRAYDVFDEAYNRLKNSRGSRHRLRSEDKDDKDDSASNQLQDYADTDFRRNNPTTAVQDDKPVKEDEHKLQDTKSETTSESNKLESPRNDNITDNEASKSIEDHVDPEKENGEPKKDRNTTENGTGDSNSRRNEQDEFSSLGKSASVYLKQIKNIFENA